MPKQDPEITKLNRARGAAIARAARTPEGIRRGTAAARLKKFRNQPANKATNEENCGFDQPTINLQSTYNQPVNHFDQPTMNLQSTYNQPTINLQSTYNQPVNFSPVDGLKEIISQQNKIISILYEKILMLENEINLQSTSKNSTYNSTIIDNNYIRGGTGGEKKSKPKKPNSEPPEFRDLTIGSRTQLIIDELKSKNGWNDKIVEDEYENMKNYHGSRGTKIMDWSKAFATWISNAQKWRMGGRGEKSESHSDKVRRLNNEGARLPTELKKEPEEQQVSFNLLNGKDNF